jgi:transcriptional regulator with XRE-family HTH domain
MDQLEHEKGRPIGPRLKEVRKARHFTLSQTSKMTGVSVSALSKIENAVVSPSFDIIKKICDGLDLPIEDLVASERSQAAELQILGRKTTTLRGEGARFTSGQYDYVAHATELSRKGMVPLVIRVHARSTDEFDHWSRHNGEEFVYVLSGAIEIHSEFYAPFRLTLGESAYFDSSMAHLYVSISEEDACVLSVSFDPKQDKKPVSAFMNAAARPVSPESPLIESENAAGSRGVARSHKHALRGKNLNDRRRPA